MHFYTALTSSQRKIWSFKLQTFRYEAYLIIRVQSVIGHLLEMAVGNGYKSGWLFVLYIS